MWLNTQHTWINSLKKPFTEQYFDQDLSMELFCNLIKCCSEAPQAVLVLKNPPANVGDTKDACSIPGSEGSPGEKYGNQLQYFWLEISMDSGAWQPTVHELQSQTDWMAGHTHYTKCFRHILAFKFCIPELYNVLYKLMKILLCP